MKIKSDKELLIELRNIIAGRIITSKANIAYFMEAIKKAKKVSQEIVDARNNINLNEQNIKKDKLFLKVIDLMLKKEK